jgi:hypothetical protein
VCLFDTNKSFSACQLEQIRTKTTIRKKVSVNFKILTHYLLNPYLGGGRSNTTRLLLDPPTDAPGTDSGLSSPLSHPLLMPPHLPPLMPPLMSTIPPPLSPPLTPPHLPPSWGPSAVSVGELTPEGAILKRVPGIFSGLCFRAAFLKKG